MPSDSSAIEPNPTKIVGGLDITNLAKLWAAEAGYSVLPRTHTLRRAATKDRRFRHVSEVIQEFGEVSLCRSENATPRVRAGPYHRRRAETRPELRASRGCPHRQRLREASALRVPFSDELQIKTSEGNGAGIDSSASTNAL